MRPCDSRAIEIFSGVTHEEWNESVSLVLVDGVLETVASQTQLVVTAQQSHLHQPDQPRLLHRRVRLHPITDARVTLIYTRTRTDNGLVH